MSKPISPPAIQREDIVEYLNRPTDSFGFELQVLRASRDLIKDCQHGGLYHDPIRKISREFDIRVRQKLTLDRDFQGKTPIQVVRLAVECTNLGPLAPLLIYRIPRSSNESYHQTVSTWRPDNYHLPTVDVTTVKNTKSIYQTGKPVGKATAQVCKDGQGKFKTTDKEVYGKLDQAIASSADLVNDPPEYSKLNPSDRAQAITIPVVVVPDDMLWVVDYDEHGKRTTKPCQAESCEYYVGKTFNLYDTEKAVSISHAHFVTLSGYVKLLDRIVTDPLFRSQLFP